MMFGGFYVFKNVKYLVTLIIPIFFLITHQHNYFIQTFD